jgi:hypothetical protein
MRTGSPADGSPQGTIVACPLERLYGAGLLLPGFVRKCSGTIYPRMV